MIELAMKALRTKTRRSLGARRLKVFMLMLSIPYICLLSGCISDQANMKQLSDAMDRADCLARKSEYEAVMNAFIEKSRAHDVDGMLGLTSNITVEKAGGLAKIRELYLQNTIPKLCEYKHEIPGGNAKAGRDDFGYYAWRFRRIFQSDNGQQRKIQFAVSKENSRLVMSFLGIWK